MSQQKEKYGQVVAAPLLGPSAGSFHASTDPMSPQNLAASAMKQQIQASADTKYDPDVPQPIEHFVDVSQKVTLGTAFLLVSFIMLYTCRQ